MVESFDNDKLFLPVLLDIQIRAGYTAFSIFCFTVISWLFLLIIITYVVKITIGVISTNKNAFMFDFFICITGLQFDYLLSIQVNGASLQAVDFNLLGVIFQMKIARLPVSVVCLVSERCIITAIALNL